MNRASRDRTTALSRAADLSARCQHTSAARRAHSRQSASFRVSTAPLSMRDQPLVARYGSEQMVRTPVPVLPEGSVDHGQAVACVYFIALSTRFASDWKSGSASPSTGAAMPEWRNVMPRDSATGA